MIPKPADHPYAIIKFKSGKKCDDRIVKDFYISVWSEIDIDYTAEITFLEENETRSYIITDIRNFIFTKGYMEFILDYVKGSTVKNI